MTPPTNPGGSKQAKDDWDYVDDMVAAAQAILTYSKGGKSKFLASPMAQDAIVHRFEVMGEAAKRMTESFRAQHPEVPWRSITAFRNRLAHGYDEIELDRVWEAVAGSLKEALAHLQRLRGE